MTYRLKYYLIKYLNLVCLTNNFLNMKNTIIMIAILIGQSLGLAAQTIQYQYDSNGNRVQQANKSCEETPANTQTQRIVLDKGWNLVSTYIQPEDYGITTIFKGIIADVKKIKDQQNSFDPNIATDFNTLQQIEDGAGYLVNMERAVTLAITGNYSSDNNTKISLKKGWNLVGYPFSQPQRIETAFATIFPQLEKVKSSFESYDPNIAPAFNTLSQVEPGKAYWIKVKEDIDFVYPSPSASGRSKTDNHLTQRDQEARQLNWKPISYPSSMIAYGKVTLDGQRVEGTAMIGVFVQGECRATALVKMTEEQSISSLVVNGLKEEVIQFFLHKDGQVYQTEFTYNLMLGKTPTQLLPLAFTTDKKKDTAPKQLLTVSPNPFSERLNITLDLPENTIVFFNLYDTRGQKIAAKNLGQLNKGTQIANWDLQNILPQLTMGIYYLEIKTNQKVCTQKIVFKP